MGRIIASASLILFVSFGACGQVAPALSGAAGIGDRVVVDNTGLKGNFDFELTFERDSAPPAGADARDPATRLQGPSIFSALQEQLGLKLVPTKGSVEVIVIDHIELPSEN